MRFVSAEEAKELFPPVWEALRAQRPGVFARSEAWWELRRLRIPDEETANPRRFVALELDGATQAYAIYRTKPGFEDGSRRRSSRCSRRSARPRRRRRRSGASCSTSTGSTTVSASLLPPDHPLFLLLATPRRMRYRMGDALWMRLVDVGAALSGRAYAGDGSVVFDVRDAFCPWNEGRWKLAGGVAERTEEPAELALDVGALGSAYLGAVSFAQLRDALRVEELADGAVERADALFAWRPLPWCPEIF